MLQSAVNRARAARQNDKGFTLIELLIVIVILGILAGIVVFSVKGIQDRGTTSACKAEVSTVDTAIEAYYAKKGTYPASLAVLSAVGNDQFLRSAPSVVVEGDYTPATGALVHAC